MTHTETRESWLHQLLHPDHVPEFALMGGMTPDKAWSNWSEDRAREAKGLPKIERHLSSAERWWYGRFDRAWQQERGVDLGRSVSAFDAQRRAGRELEPEAT